MGNDLLTTLFSPFVDLAQNFVDVSFAVLALFGFTAPNVSAIINSLFGIA